MKDGRFPLSILFYAEGLAFHGGPIEHQSLGGSESALWHMARELAKRGHLVDVCCHCPYPNKYDGVTYYDLTAFPQLQIGKEYDLVIASRYFPILARPLRSKMNWLWLHDMPSGPQAARQMASNLFQTEQVMVLSDFQRQAYLKDCPELEPLLWNTTNGVDLDLIRKYGLGKRRPKHLIYASRPERGLDYLLAVIWPQLLAQDPELELWVCGYDVKSYPFNDEMRQFYEQVDQLVEHTPRVTNLGALSKADYYLRLSQCALMVYPTAFSEISCCTGDTLVDMPRDYRIHPNGVPIRDLVGKSGFPVYCIDEQTHTFTLRAVKWVAKTRSNAPIVRVNFDDGTYLRVTPDHRIMLTNGQWVEAGKLKPGSRVMSLRKFLSVDVNINFRGKRIPEHRMVAEWQTGRKLVAKEHIHHRDECDFNNSPDNLIPLADGDHHRHHGFTRKGAAVSEVTRKRMSKSQTAAIRARVAEMSEEEYQVWCNRNRANSTQWWASLSPNEKRDFVRARSAKVSEAGRQKQHEALRARTEAQWGNAPWRNRELLYDLYITQKQSTTAIAHTLGTNNQTVRAWLYRFGITVRTQSEAHLIAYAGKDLWRDEARLRQMYVVEGKSAVEIAKLFDCSRQVVQVWLRQFGIRAEERTQSQLRKQYGAGYANHVVTSVIGDGCEDVYDMEVEEHHNFVANGVVVHNCIAAMEAMASGTPIVTTHGFALKETIPYASVSGMPSDPGYAERFVAMTLALLTHDIGKRQIVRQGKQWVEEHYQWKQVAEKWEDQAFELFERRLQQHPVAIARGLLWNSDVVIANEMVGQIEADNGSSYPGDIMPAAQFSQLHEILLESEHALAHHHEDPDAYFDHATPAAEWASVNARYQHVIDLVPAAANSVRPLRVADVGCGSGALLGQLCHKRPDVEGYGFDFSEKLIHAATALAVHHDVQNVFFGQIDILQGDGLMTGYDVVLACEILEHVPNYWELLDRCERACKPGGTIILTVPSGPWEANSYNEDYDYTTGYPTRYHVHHFELRDLQDIFGEKLHLQIEYRNGGFSVQGEPLGWWFVRYQNDPKRKTGRVNVERKILTAKPRQTIAACMIVKNEAKNLERCLDSIVPYIDELWIWDCGSTDRTIELAESYCQRYTPRVQIHILNIDPDGDRIPNFAAWRNESISQTNADWIAWADADEILHDGRNLRKYATPCSLFNAYVIKQNHLVFQQQFIPADLPQRLFRNHKGYQWFGSIHEQPGLTLNDEIQPSLCLPDVDIIHFGYVTAEDTRWKCFERNMPALLKDRRMNPTRHLGPLLVMRDGLNKAQYLLEQSGLQMTDQVLLLVRNAAIVFLQHYADPKDKYHGYAFTFYQLALRALGVRGIPLVDGGTPPFEVKVQMAVGVGGLDDRPLEQPSSRWFHSPQEYNKFLMEQSDAALAPMIAQAERYAEQTNTTLTGGPSPTLAEQSEELLRNGGDPVSGLGADLHLAAAGEADPGAGRAGDGGDSGGDGAAQ